MSERLRETLYRLEAALVMRDPAGLDVGLADLLDDAFLELGASGRTWDAASTREALAGATAAGPVELMAFDAVELAPGVALVTYRLGLPRPTNRSSIWVRRDGRWRMRFHHGTLRPEA